MENSLTKIASLKTCGAFADFKWEDGPGANVCLKRRNIFFGWNGSGKTTLSRIFRAVENWQSVKSEPNALPGGWDVRLQVQGDGAFQLKKDKINKLPPVFVFNRDYVQESVVGQSSLSPIVTLGKDSADDAAKLKELEVERAEVEAQDTVAIQELRKAEKVWEGKCSAGARKIKDDLGGRNVAEFRNFEAPAFKKRFEAFANDPTKFAPARLTDDDLATQLTTVSAEEKQAVSRLPSAADDLAATLDTVKEVCGRSVVVDAIKSLENTADVEAWVRTGLALHENHEATHCLYCGEDIPEGRTEALKRHFDAAYDQLLADIDAASTKLAAAKKAHEDLSKAIPASDAILAPLRSDYTKAKDALTDQISTRVKIIDEAIEYLKTRQTQPLKDFTLTMPVIAALGIDAANKLIDTHNTGVSDHRKLVKDASNKVADHVVADCETDWKAYQEADKTLNAQRAAFAAKRVELDDGIAMLRTKVEGHAATADELNRDLKDYLGHGDITLVPVPTGYKLQRRGADASVDSLSEGEKTALAVLYFLRRLDDKKVDRTKSLIVIDDPVSSLDSNALYAAITFICNKLDNAGQVILLTHSFTAFREWKNWASKIKGGEGLLQCRAVDVGGQRCCTISKLDELLQDYESEYHYLFRYVVQASKGDCNSRELLPLPNVARRVLEAFLAFKRPRPREGTQVKEHGKSGDLDLDEYRGKLANFADDRLQRLDRFVNYFSHNDRVPVPGSDVTPTGEAKRSADDLIEFMQALDKEHVAAMSALVDPPAATGDAAST